MAGPHRPVGAIACATAFMFVAGPAAAQTFSTGANFTTMSLESTFASFGNSLEPPDTMGAAGLNHFVALQNGSCAIYTKSGTLVSQVSDTAFWSAALGFNPGNLSDPRIVYDPASRRWYASMITTGQSTNNQILLARSNTSDPTQGFKAVAYTTTNGTFADYPTLGVDANGVHVGTNNFNAAGTSLLSVGLYSVPKADLAAATPTLANLTNNGTLSASTVGFTLQAAVNYGPKLATDPTPVLAISNTQFGHYKFTPVTGTTGPGAVIGATTDQTVLATSNPTASRQPGTSVRLPNNDSRFDGSVIQVGNFLYAVHGITVSTRSAARWTIANATTFAIVQQGTISSSSLSYFYPSIAVNTSGDVVIAFSGSNTSTFASTYAVVGSSAGGVAGGTLTFGSPVQTHAGTASYTFSRWGDYSAVTPDPTDPGIFWAHEEDAATPGPNFASNWATQATEIVPTKAGERRWSNSTGGSFTAPANYFTATAPVATDHVIFSRPNATYAVGFAGSNTSNRATVRQGDVTWNLGGGSYTLSNASAATPSLAVSDSQGTSSLTVAGGTLNTANATIGAGFGGSGTVALNAGATWNNSGTIYVGGNAAGPQGGTGVLRVNGTLNNGAVQVWAGGLLTGAGTVGGAVTVSGAATSVTFSGTTNGVNSLTVAAAEVAPGNGVGTLAIGTGTFGAGTIFHIELGGLTDTAANRDQLAVAAALNFTSGATILISEFGAPAFAVGTTYTYTIATTGGAVQVDGSGANSLGGIVLTSDFASPSEFSLTRSGNNLVLNFTPVPEPAWAVAVLAAGLAAAVRRRR